MKNKNSEDEIIQISKEGIKLSYYRFITESTPGYIFIIITVGYLFVLRAFYGEYSTIKMLSNLKISGEFEIALVLILILIALPIGGLISAISYYAFGWIEVVLIRLILKFNSFLTVLPKVAYNYNKLKKEYELESSNFLKKGYKIHRKNEVENIMITKPGIRATRTFARNLIFLTIYTTILVSIHLDAQKALISFGIALILVFILGLICALELFVSHLNVFLADYNLNK